MGRPLPSRPDPSALRNQIRFGSSISDMAANRVLKSANLPTDRPMTLHEQAELRRKAARMQRNISYDRRKENYEAYQAEIAAEKSGQAPQQKTPGGPVRQVAHGVAAQADASLKSHGVSAKGTGTTGLASAPGSTTKPSGPVQPSTPPPMLKDIMF